jgi:hypothetical protein
VKVLNLDAKSSVDVGMALGDDGHFVANTTLALLSRLPRRVFFVEVLLSMMGS